MNLVLRLCDDQNTYELVDQSRNHGTNRVIRDANLFLVQTRLRGLSLHTCRSYGYDLISIFRWLSGTKKSAKGMTERDLFSFIEFEKKRDQAASSINRRLVTLVVFYRYLYGKDIPPALKTSLPGSHYRGRGKDSGAGIFRVKRRRSRMLQIKTPSVVIRPLQIDEVNAFIKDIHSYRDLAITLLMLFCGLRSLEVRLLRLEDIDFKGSKLLIHGKGAKERVVPAAAIVLRVIEKYISLERPVHSGVDAVFLIFKGKSRGNAMTAAGFRSLFRYRRRSTGVANANPHRFRHSFGSSLVRQKVTYSILQSLLGHAPGSRVTLRYMQLSLSDVADAYLEAMTKIEAQYAASHL